MNEITRYSTYLAINNGLPQSYVVIKCEYLDPSDTVQGLGRILIAKKSFSFCSLIMRL
jgi:hypothetical protein